MKLEQFYAIKRFIRPFILSLIAIGRGFCITLIFYFTLYFLITFYFVFTGDLFSGIPPVRKFFAVAAHTTFRSLLEFYNIFIFFKEAMLTVYYYIIKFIV
jgi:hypothetical protein